MRSTIAYANVPTEGNFVRRMHKSNSDHESMTNSPTLWNYAQWHHVSIKYKISEHDDSSR